MKAGHCFAILLTLLTFFHAAAQEAVPEPAPSFLPITANADWIPVIRAFDVVDMVYVPAGCFMMGAPTHARDLEPVEPVHQQCFEKSFWIDRYEVTNQQFADFGGVSAQASNWPEARRPRENVTWFEARDFCALRGARLPTEREWEYAARGPDSLKYPWGSEFDPDRLVYRPNSASETAPVGSRPAGASWVGAQDMLGNVREWVSSYSVPYPYLPDEAHEGDAPDRRRVIRGGSFLSLLNSTSESAVDRAGSIATTWENDLGFRCARDDESATAVLPISGQDVNVRRGPGTNYAVEFVLSADAVVSWIGRDDAGTWLFIRRVDGRMGWIRADLLRVVEPVAHNADWTPVIRDFDGVPMALVPPGCFLMGSEDGEIVEQPVHQQCFEQPFWIDRYEVTSKQFADFGGVAAQLPLWIGENHPRDRVTWFEARNFCALRGARLPTEREWEYAARGPDSLKYPWGDNFAAANVVYLGSSDDESDVVGSRSGGASWVGAHDLSGNVWEWVSSLSRPYPYDPNDGRESSLFTQEPRVLRGGSFANPEANLRAAYRGANGPSYWNYLDGFRCARDFG